MNSLEIGFVDKQIENLIILKEAKQVFKNYQKKIAITNEFKDLFNNNLYSLSNARFFN